MRARGAAAEAKLRRRRWRKISRLPRYFSMPLTTDSNDPYPTALWRVKLLFPSRRYRRLRFLSPIACLVVTTDLSTWLRWRDLSVFLFSSSVLLLLLRSLAFRLHICLPLSATPRTIRATTTRGSGQPMRQLIL